MLNSGIAPFGGFGVIDSHKEFSFAGAEHVTWQDNIFSSRDKRLDRSHDSIKPNQSHNSKPEPTIAQSNTTDSFNNNLRNRSSVRCRLSITPDESKVPRVLKLSFEVQVCAL
ncbi:unnamed protein product [Polarella glacialis]|uniref:Uncharacterized protein n=1 Tax=Polarella glacialis TaxID=89957 RepID=A0A813D1F9_POLGL|nr:unnamed protein product [Polarella glacialis]CAE8638602.1 unnamed protein product [Polarella glacialis]